MKDLKKQIRSRLIAKGLVYDDVAREAGCTRSNVSYYLSGAHKSKRVTDALIKLGVLRAA